MTRNNVLLPQSVLGALIAVNLKNSLKQLTDPYYLWRQRTLDRVGSCGLSVPIMPLPPPPTPQPVLLSTIPLVGCSLFSIAEG